MMDRDVIKITTLGLEERSRLVLANALSKYSQDRYCLVNSGSPQLALIDLDNGNAAVLLRDFSNSHPTIPLIGLGTKPGDMPVHAHILKPVNLQQLLIAIAELTDTQTHYAKNMITQDKIAQALKAVENKKIAKSLQQRAEQAEAKSASRRAMPSKSDEMCFDPDRFLLGVMLTALSQATETRQIAVLTCWHDRSIVLDPAQASVSTNLTDNQLRNLAIAPTDDNLSSPITTRFYQSIEVNRELDAILTLKEMRRFTQEAFLWNLGLLTCRGRIPAEFTVCNRHYLRRWPNLTRVNIPANAMRILAYWSQQPCSLMDIKEQLDVPLQEIFSVFSAAYAAGLTGEAKRKSDQIMQTIELNDHNRRGLMKSIISRLRGEKTEKMPKSA